MDSAQMTWSDMPLGDRDDRVLLVMGWLKSEEAEKVRSTIIHESSPLTYDNLPDWLVGWLVDPRSIPEHLIDPSAKA